MTAPAQRIGIVGLGIMGSAIATHLKQAGYMVSGFDTDDRRREDLAGIGGDALASVAEVGASADLVITSLPSPGALHSVAAELADGNPGLVVAETSTLAIEDKQDAADLLAEHEVTLLDCPLSGTGSQARAGELVAFLSGTADGLDLAEPVFSAFCRETVRTGVFGTGMTIKLIANLLVAVHTLAAAEALQLAERAGLVPAQVVSALSGSAADSTMLQVRGPIIAAGAWERPNMRLELFMKDLTLIQELGASAQARLPLFSTALENYRAALDAGLGDYDSAAVAAMLY